MLNLFQHLIICLHQNRRLSTILKLNKIFNLEFKKFFYNNICFVCEQKQININKGKEERHDNYKKYIRFNDILLDNQTQFGTISQQPTPNRQQPTANSQQVIFTVIILYFVIYILCTRAVSEFGVFSHFILWLLFFYAYLAVRLRSLTVR